MHDIQPVVRHTFLKPLIKRQKVASCAGVREFHWSHQLAARERVELHKWYYTAEIRSFAVDVADFRADIVCVGIRCRPRTRSRAVAISAIKLNKWSCRAAPDLFHVDGVIQLDVAEIARAISESSKLRVPVFEAANVRCVVRASPIRAKIRMACRARLIAGRGDVDAPPVVGMAFRASHLFSSNDAHRVVNRPIVTAKASAVGSFRRKYSRRLQVTSGAFFLENRVRFGQAPAAVNAPIFEKRPCANPHQREQRQQQAKPKFRPLQRRRSLEIVEIDALREFFGCACTCHGSLGLVAQRHHSMDGAKQNQCKRKRNM